MDTAPRGEEKREGEEKEGRQEQREGEKRETNTRKGERDNIQCVGCQQRAVSIYCTLVV